MGSRLNPNSDAWGGAWGSASAWGGTWGWSWGPLYEIEEEPVKKRGGAGGGDIKQRERTNKRNKFLKQQAIEEGEIAIILNVLVSQGLIR